MGIWRYSNIVYMNDNHNLSSHAYTINVGDYIMTDMSVSKVYFKDKSKSTKMLLKFTVKSIGEIQETLTTICVTPNHIMLRVRDDSLSMAANYTGSSSDSGELRVPEMLKCDKVRADKIMVGDTVPRFAGSCGIIISAEYIMGKSIQLMTDNGLIMIDKNIITCYVRPLKLVSNSAKPVAVLSGISSLLVSKPFYYIPKKIYNFGLDHYG